LFVREVLALEDLALALDATRIEQTHEAGA
jgi:hypothetical protein